MVFLFFSAAKSGQVIEVLLNKIEIKFILAEKERKIKAVVNTSRPLRERIAVF
jgi:hypothetical protein